MAFLCSTMFVCHSGAGASHLRLHRVESQRRGLCRQHRSLQQIQLRHKQKMIIDVGSKLLQIIVWYQANNPIAYFVFQLILHESPTCSPSAEVLQLNQPRIRSPWQRFSLSDESAATPRRNEIKTVQDPSADNSVRGDTHAVMEATEERQSPRGVENDDAIGSGDDLHESPESQKFLESDTEGLITLWGPTSETDQDSVPLDVLLPIGFDVVAVHGFFGTRQSPWENPGSGSCEWLKTWRNQKECRVMSFGRSEKRKTGVQPETDDHVRRS
ncbi:hypothetical protein F4777DRAFT_64822 [Nemania sp. FL0916]|nr:hypothetical protein F4777DRAFT_64822 [Nemania sp. FL0916]